MPESGFRSEMPMFIQRAVISWVRIPLIADWGGWFTVADSAVVIPISLPGKICLSVAGMPRMNILGTTGLCDCIIGGYE